MFVFKPSEPRPLYVQRNICGEEVRWGVFVPRDVPEALTSEALQWLNRSQFYFLTASQVRALPRRPAAVPRGGIAAGTGAGLWKDCSPRKASGVRCAARLCPARLCAARRPEVAAPGSERQAGLPFSL